MIGVVFAVLMTVAGLAVAGVCWRSVFARCGFAVFFVTGAGQFRAVLVDLQAVGVAVCVLQDQANRPVVGCGNFFGTGEDAIGQGKAEALG